MKSIITLTSLTALLLAAPASAGLEAGSTWHATKEQGGVSQSVEVVLGKLAVGTSFEATVEWTPGTSVEVTAKISKSGAERIEFTFEDSFGNTGTGVLTSTGNTAEIDFTTTKLVEPRGARQLGAYTLRKAK